MAASMQFTEEKGVLSIFLKGALRSLESVEFGEAVDERLQTGQAAMIDLSGVDTLDSRGLSELIQVVTRARLRNARVVLVQPTPFVAGLLATTRLDQWFEIFDSTESAQRALRGGNLT